MNRANANPVSISARGRLKKIRLALAARNLMLMLISGLALVPGLAAAARVSPVSGGVDAGGSYSYTVPAGVTQVNVTMSGAGGGQGGGDSGAGGVDGGSGLLMSFVLNVTPGQVVWGTAGKAGVAGVSGECNGTDDPGCTFVKGTGGAGGSEQGSGGSGGDQGSHHHSGGGGGGGGGTSLALGSSNGSGTVLAKSGGGGGAQGGSWDSIGLYGGNASALTTATDCASSGSGGTGDTYNGTVPSNSKHNPGTNDGGGGGGGGYAGGAGGTGHPDAFGSDPNAPDESQNTNADGYVFGFASTGGSSCIANSSALNSLTTERGARSSANGFVDIAPVATGPTISFQKALGGSGRIAASDQFSLSGSGTGAPAATTTTGSGVVVGSSPYSFTATAGSSYTLNEAMATGSASSLSQYTQTVSCSNSGPTDVNGKTSLPISLTPQTGDAISCLVTNTPATSNPGGGSSTPAPICNGDPIVAGSDFTNNAWAKSGPWQWVLPNSIALYNDQATATLTQNLQGVTPSTMITFTWRFRNGVVPNGDVGNRSTLKLFYNGVLYWTGQTSNGAGSAPDSTVSNSAICVSGCSGALAAQTDRVIKVRLPSTIPLNGTLRFEAEEYGGTSDDPEIRTPVTMTSTGICLAKNSRGGTGTFRFTANGADTTWGSGGTTASITTTTVDTPAYYDADSTRVNNQPLIVKNPGSSANVTITESAVPNGFTLDSVSCNGVTPVRSGNSITIANVPLDSVSTCTFINRGQIISLSKALNGNRANANDNFSVAIRTGGVNGTVVSSTANSTTTGSGATITAGTGTTGDFYATNGTSYTLTEAGTSGTSLANYTSMLSCTDAAGVTSAASLPTNETFDPAVGRSITPVAGANLRCVISNRSKFANLSLQKALGGSGRLAATDQFTLSGTGSGAPAAITTTGSGANITSAPYAFSATPGNSYALNEAMDANSVSGLSQYNQTLRCTNSGTTDVSALTSLPISVTPAGGDDISCVVTNTPNGSGAPTQSTAICNADAIISGNDLSNTSAWSAPPGLVTADGTWSQVSSGSVAFTNDDDAKGAALTQQVNGVTPGALLTFTWSFRNGITTTGAEGATSTLKVSYNGVIYWTGTTPAGNLGNASAAASAVSNGATCVSGCTGTLSPLTDRVIQIRLPATLPPLNIASLPVNGELKFLAQSPNAATWFGVSDDIFVKTNISIKNTGICLAKTSLGASGNFSFTTTGVDTNWDDTASNTAASITTQGANTQTYYDASATRSNSQPLLVLKPGAAAGTITFTEAATTGFTLDSVSCTGTVTATRGTGTNSNKISLSSVAQDTVETCTVVNRTAIVNLSKALGSSRAATNDNFKVAIRTGGNTGGIVSSTANATTAGSGSTITAGTGTTGDYYTTPGQTYALTESGTPGTDLSNYSAKLTCTDSSGLTPAASLPNGEAFDPAAGRLITPVAGANLRCVITNTITTKVPTLTGKVILDTGVGSGTAHDGVQNGTETGRSGVIVRLTNCGATEYARSTTDSSGSFSFDLPATVIPGPVCVVKLPSSGFVAVSGNPGTTAGTYTQSTDTLQFTLVANTSYSGIVLGEVPMSSLLTDGQKQALPGATVVYAHTYNAGTSASVLFSTSDVFASSEGNWTSQIYRDNDCNGQLGSGDQPLTAAVTVTAGQTVCLLNVVNVPASAPDGAHDVTTVAAQETLTPAPAAGPLVFNYSRTDTTTVSLSSALVLSKEVRRLSSCPANAAVSQANSTAYGTSNSAKAGDAIEYRITYSNNGSTPVANVNITDSMPAFTVFQGAWCLSTPTIGITGCAVQSSPANGATSGTVVWKLTDAAPPSAGLRPGASGTVGFCVKVQQ